MRITIERTTTVGELLSEIAVVYGDERALQARLRKNRKDAGALVALHNLREYASEKPAKQITETREVVVPDSKLGLLTATRLHLLLSIKDAKGEVEGLRRLAELVNRDVKNVSDDVQVLRSLGLLTVESHGPGRPSTIKLPGQAISLHLVEDATAA